MTTIARPSPFNRFCAVLLGLAAACAQAAAPAPASGRQGGEEEEPTTLILSDTLHYDDVKRESTFTGNVVMTRGLMTLNADRLEMREDAEGFQYGVATVNAGNRVYIRQDRPETFEVIEARGQRGEYDGKQEQIDVIGQAVITRFVCGKPFDSVSGQRIRYNQKTDTYEAFGGPESAAAGGRVRSLAVPRAKSEAAVEACRKSQAADQQPPAPAGQKPGQKPQAPAAQQPAAQ